MSHSPAYYAWQRFKKNRIAFAGLLYIGLCALIAILGPLILPDHSPDSNEQILELETRRPGFSVQMLRLGNNADQPHSFLNRLLHGEENNSRDIPVNFYRETPDKIFVVPYDSKDTVAYSSQNARIIQRTYLLGTDRYGRDMLSRLLLGTRISLSVGLISVAISLLVGIFLGAIAGFFRGWADSVIQWVINVVWSVPTLLLVMAISLVLGRGFWQVFVAVGLTMWVDVARMVRGQILSARELEYVQAGRALGLGNFRLIFMHILPNISGPIMVISAANFAAAIVLESGLSFLGVGVQPPAPSWGMMLNDHFGYLIMGSAYLAILPGLAIMLIVLAFNMLGNGLRDALDVRMK